MAEDEATFQANVIQLATQMGWRHMHVRRTRGKTRGGWKWLTGTNVDGWPDLTLWHERRQRLIFVECKADDGELSPAQEELLGSLLRAGQQVHVWAPRDWEGVVVPTLTFDRGRT